MARILYVDDEQALVFLMTRMLEVLGHGTTGFTSAPEALEAYRADPERFDLVITDMSMAGMNGLEFAQEILAIRADVPLAIATGHVLQQDVEAARRLGVLDVMPKPGSLDEWEKALAGLLEKIRPAGQPVGR